MPVKLDMIGIVTVDIAESVRFYRTLGLDVPDPQPGEPYHEVALSSGLRVSWNDVEMIKQIDPSWVPPVGQRLGMAFLCESPAAVDAAYAKLTAEGFRGHKEPWDAFWGQRYAVVLDPDGGAVDLFAPL